MSEAHICSDRAKPPSGGAGSGFQGIVAADVSRRTFPHPVKSAPTNVGGYATVAPRASAELLGLTLSLPMSRREVLQVGLFGLAGLLLDHHRVFGADATPAAQAASPVSAAPGVSKARSVIQIFLWGGMSHNDTWDPKPDAGYDYNGSLKNFLPTNVEGILLSEWFPKLAKQVDKYSLIRSMTHRNNGHETAAYLMQTAHTPGERLAFPSVGAVFAYFKSKDYKGLIPPYVVLTQPQGRFSEEGFLGRGSNPLPPGAIPMPPGSRWKAWSRAASRMIGRRTGATCCTSWTRWGAR